MLPVFSGFLWLTPLSVRLTFSVWSEQRLTDCLRNRKRRFSSVYFTVNGLQFIVSEDEWEEFGPGTEAQRWRHLQAVVAQVQVLQFTQGLRKRNEEIRQQDVPTHRKYIWSWIIVVETFRNSAHSWILLWLTSKDFRTFSKLWKTESVEVRWGQNPPISR